MKRTWMPVMLAGLALLVATWMLRQPRAADVPEPGDGTLAIAPLSPVAPASDTGAAAPVAPIAPLQDSARPPAPLHVEMLDADGKPIPMLQLRGTIRDESGAPVADVNVGVVAGKDVTAPELACVSAADGRFELPPFPARRGTFVIMKPGYMTISGSLPRPPPAGTAPSLGVTLRHAVTLRGVLRWRDGEPCAGASLQVRAALAETRDDRFVSSLGDAVTNADGRFAIDGLATRQVVQLHANAGGFKPHHPFTIELFAEPQQDVTLELARPAGLQIVLDDLAARTDIPAEEKEHMHLALFTQGDFDLVGQAFGTTDVPTFARLDPASTFDLCVNVDGFESRWFRDGITLHEGSNTWHGSLGELVPEVVEAPREERHDWSFRWSFVDEQHHPMKGAEANARWTEGRLGAALLLRARSLGTGEEETVAIDFSRSGTLLDSGEADVSLAPPIELSVELGGARQVLSPVVKDQAVELVVPVPADVARVSFVARDAAGRRVRMPACSVKRKDREEVLLLPEEASASASGAWLRPGDYTVFTYGGECARNVVDFHVEDAAPRSVELLLQHGGVLAGTVSLPDTLVPESVQVLGRGADLDAARSWAAPRGDGSFELTGMTPGEVTVTLLAHDSTRGDSVALSLPATIVADRLTQVRFDAAALDAATGELLVRLTSCAEASLSLGDADGSFALSLSLKRGTDCRLRVPRGTLRYRVEPVDPAALEAHVLATLDVVAAARAADAAARAAVASSAGATAAGATAAGATAPGATSAAATATASSVAVVATSSGELDVTAGRGVVTLEL